MGDIHVLGTAGASNCGVRVTVDNPILSVRIIIAYADGLARGIRNFVTFFHDISA